MDLIVYEPTSDTSKREVLFRKWNVELDSYEPELQTDYDKKYHGKTNSLELVKEKLNWTNKTFVEINQKLGKANCIGITSGNPTTIDYGYQGMGVFKYLIFDKDLNGELQEKYSDDCTQLFYKDNVVLEYGSGAIGSLCTPEFKRGE